MGRGNNRRQVDNNESQMPQVPKYDIKNGSGGDDLEIANELGDRYVIERTPGFGATGVSRKRNQAQEDSQ
jgi:hypothetical protein